MHPMYPNVKRLIPVDADTSLEIATRFADFLAISWPETIKRPPFSPEVVEYLCLRNNDLIPLRLVGFLVRKPAQKPHEVNR